MLGFFKLIPWLNSSIKSDLKILIEVIEQKLNMVMKIQWLDELEKVGGALRMQLIARFTARNLVRLVGDLNLNVRMYEFVIF